MTADDFEALARKAGLAKYGLGWTAWESQLERFAKLVEEHALRALAQPEQEPVAWRYDEATYRPYDLRGRQWHFTLFSTRKPYADEMVQNVTPLYTAPPQRKPLTDDQIAEICMDCSLVTPSDIYFARAIEKAHGIK